jgi:phage tail-like protein
MMNKHIAIAAVASVAALLALAVVGVQAPSGSRREPFAAYYFRVSIEGVGGTMPFASVQGLSCETEIVEYRSGDQPNLTKHLPGPTSCGPITLRRGVTANTDLFDWFQSVANGNLDLRSGSVILFDKQGKDVAQYDFLNAWPAKWSIPDMDSDQSGMIVEELELAVERIEKA